MTTEISHINVQYTKTIGRGEQFGPGFTYPIYVARGKEDRKSVGEGKSVDLGGRRSSKKQKHNTTV